LTLWASLFGEKRAAVADVRRHLKQAQASLQQTLEAMRKAEHRAGWEEEFLGGHPPDSWDSVAQEAWWEAQRQMRKKRGGP
jgi:hypothetical protein